MTESKMLWGGRFGASPDDEMLALTRSLETDIVLLECDVAATRAHARVLVDAGLLDREALARLDGVCDELLRERAAGSLDVQSADEDVHSLVERVLTERLGPAGARIHAGRSRNDLVATDLRLWCRARSSECAGLVAALLEQIASLAEKHVHTVMPGYTHLQRAQPVSLGFHLLAHGFALGRDGKRFLQAYESADSSPLGAGALAGTTLALDARIGAAELGFSGVFANAMDAVSDRDFACDLLYAAALCGVHLSRVAEELVGWTSAEFGFARLPDQWATGSSMMPQKRNPDLAELVRGRAAGGVADLTGLLTLLKGLPLAYDRDLQEDKSFMFAALPRLATSIVATTRLLEVVEFDGGRLEEAAAAGEAWATDIAEALVTRGVPFREAHAAAGSLVAALQREGTTLADASEETLKAHHPLLKAGDTQLADPRRSMEARQSIGGTAPARVSEQIAALRAIAGDLKDAQHSI